MIFAFCGKSSSGKDTVLKEVSRILNKSIIVSSTSRPRRDNEENKVDYYFLTKKEFENKLKLGEFFEYRVFDTILNNKPQRWYYGIEYRNIIEDGVIVLDMNGAVYLSEFYNTKIIYLDCPDIIRTERARKRASFCEHEWNRRLDTDSQDFKGASLIADKIIDAGRPLEEVVKDVILSIQESQDIK